jgi:hypothetical protein
MEVFMKSAALQMIETQLPLLSSDEQLLLIERLVRQLRRRRITPEMEAELVEMANDPQIQKELREINEEFAVTEEDGLEGL